MWSIIDFTGAATMAMTTAAAGAGLAWAAARPRLGQLAHELRVRDWGLANLRSELADQEDLFDAFVENTSDIVIRLNAAGQAVYASPSCHPVLGYEPADVLGHACFDLVHPDEQSWLRDMVASGSARVPEWDGSLRVRRRDGQLLAMDVRCRPLTNGLGVLLIWGDITRRRLAEERLAEAQSRLEYLTLHDPVTDLPNRRCFMERLENLLAEQTGVALLLVNCLDRHGRETDETVMQALGGRLRNSDGRRGRETAEAPWIARVGENQFGVLLRAPDGDTEVAEQARHILQLLAAPLHGGGTTLQLSAAIGIAMSPRDGADAADLVRRATMALDHAAKTGQATYCFFETRMEEALAKADNLKRELPQAIAAGEIVPYFQPLVRMENNTILGFEVLARWHHPTKGMILPAQFMPLAEETGLSMAVLISILTRACYIAREWPSYLKLSVNLPQNALRDETLPDEVRRIIDETGFSGDRLEIEVSEHDLLPVSTAARGVLEQLRDLGMSIVLDEFGAGLSSISLPRELPFDTVKIDRSLVAALTIESETGDTEASRHLAAIVGFAQAYHLELASDGIDNDVGSKRLSKLGVTVGQGYLFGQPMSERKANQLHVTQRWPAMAAE